MPTESEKAAGLLRGGVLLLGRGLCAKCMHLGPYGNEPATVAAMEEHFTGKGYRLDFSQGRFPHEILWE